MTEDKKRGPGGAILGMLIGIAIGAGTGQWWWIGVGFALGFAIDAARGGKTH